MSTAAHHHSHGEHGTGLRGRLHQRISEAHAGMFGLARHAASYDRFMGRLAQPLYRRVVADVAALRLPAGAFVLDVGTGPGQVPRRIARACPSLTVEGVDLSEQMIEAAVRSAADSGADSERLHYRVADVAALPYPDASVDLVVSSLSLHHWTQVPAGLAEIRRVLRPGGEAWIYDARTVLDRAADQLDDRTRREATVERLRDAGSRRWTSRLITASVGRAMGRLRIVADGG